VVEPDAEVQSEVVTDTIGVVGEDPDGVHPSYLLLGKLIGAVVGLSVGGIDVVVVGVSVLSAAAVVLDAELEVVTAAEKVVGESADLPRTRLR
jgi:hypothetical protein